MKRSWHHIAQANGSKVSKYTFDKQCYNFICETMTTCFCTIVQREKE